MNEFNINTIRDIRISRKVASYARTKGIITRSVLCTNDLMIVINNVHFGIANKINKFADIDVYYESKWNTVKCMDELKLVEAYKNPIEIEETLEENDSIIEKPIENDTDINEDDSIEDIVENSGNSITDTIPNDEEQSTDEYDSIGGYGEGEIKNEDDDVIEDRKENITHITLDDKVNIYDNAEINNSPIDTEKPFAETANTNNTNQNNKANIQRVVSTPPYRKGNNNYHNNKKK